MIIALNNKSNLKKEDFLMYQKELKIIQTNHKLILCPSTLFIPLYEPSKIFLGAQNVSKFNIGAHTGEVSAEQLASFGVEYCIVGHSERRLEQYEKNTDTNLKIKRLLEQDITPILCIGEKKEEKENKTYKDKIRQEILDSILELTEDQKEKIIIAYEPIWSIGTGVVPTNEEIKEIFDLIKEVLPKNKILYGGSANNDTIGELKKCDFIDGYLLGGISLKPDKLKEFIETIEK